MQATCTAKAAVAGSGGAGDSSGGGKAAAAATCQRRLIKLESYSMSAGDAVRQQSRAGAAATRRLALPAAVAGLSTHLNAGIAL